MSDPPLLPPAFPQWMRDREPLLAEEDTNGLFQAFRELRARRAAARPWYRRPAAVASAVAGTVLLFPFYAILAIRVSPILVAVGLMIALTLLLVAVFGVRKAGEVRLPDRLGDLFLLQNLRSQGMLDLCQMPVRGRDVLVAIYLEAREQTLPGLKTFSITLGIVGPLFWTLSQIGEWWLLLGDAVFVLPAFVYATTGLPRALQRGTESQAVDVLMASRVATWRPPIVIEWRKLLVQVVRSTGAILVIVALGVVVALVLVPVLARLPRILPEPPEMRWLTNSIREHPRAYGWLVHDTVFLAAGALFRMRRKQDKLRERVEKLLAEGDEHFHGYLLRTVLGDE